MSNLCLKWCFVLAACSGRCLEASAQSSDLDCLIQTVTGLQPEHTISTETAPNAAEVAKQVLGKVPPDVSKAMQMLRTSKRTLSKMPQCKRMDVRSDHLLHPRKYHERLAQCGTDRGMWQSSHTAPVRQFKYDVMVQAMGLTHGHHVMDWGTGCGKELHLAAERFGFQGFGIDVVQGNIDYASSHYNKTAYCLSDGSKLPYQDDSFDAIISNAALYHVNGIDPELNAVNEMLRVLRPGGCGWMAWLGCDGDRVTQQDWETKVVPGAVLTTLNEMEALGATEYESKQAYSLIFCKNDDKHALKAL